jgi:hypothetical protein
MLLRALAVMMMLWLAATPIPPVALAAEETVPAAAPSEAVAVAEAPAEERTFLGEIVDPAGYLKEGRRGPEAVAQTFEAVDGGQTLALLEDATNALYLFLAEVPGEDPNELVYDYVNQRMKVTGRVYSRGGMEGIVVSAVEPLEPADTQAATPAPTTTN